MTGPVADFLLEKMANAILRTITHYRAYRMFTQCLLEGYPNELKQWASEVQEWENDLTSSCPYEVDDENGISIIS